MPTNNKHHLSHRKPQILSPQFSQVFCIACRIFSFTLHSTRITYTSPKGWSTQQPHLRSQSLSNGGAVCRHELELASLSGLKDQVASAAKLYAAVVASSDGRSAGKEIRLQLRDRRLRGSEISLVLGSDDGAKSAGDDQQPNLHDFPRSDRLFAVAAAEGD